jgi:hypothetical protein
MTIEIYTFEDKDGREFDWSTMSAEEAKEYAQKHSLRMIANTFSFEDSEPVEDYT